MHRGRFAGWSWPWKKTSREPSAALFQGLRIRLTLWYCGVLGAALVLFCVALYTGAYYFLFSPTQNDAAIHAHKRAEQLLAGSPAQACLPSGPPGPRYTVDPDYPMSEIVACYDQNGTLVQTNLTDKLSAAILDNTLAKTAMQTGRPVSDIVDGGSNFGHIYRYAQPVADPQGNGYIGVIVMSESIQRQQDLLSLLLALLLSVGGVTLLGAGLGGLFLASRALEPAHLAFTRQQRFIADASHELRTPLTLMRADAEVLLRGRAHLAEEDTALLEDIVAEANHMSVLANNMLTLARLDANTQHREHEVVNLADLAEQGIERVTAFARQKGIQVRHEGDGDTFVIGDPLLLEQAVLVLLDNAIKYNRPDGQVTLRTSVRNKEALLEVIDTGIGIAQEHLPRLGERFYRVDKARSREAGGTGLGLSIAQRTAAVHDGQLKLTSVPDQGTVAALVLPLAAGISRETELAAQEQRAVM